MNELIAYFQLGANAVAIATASWIYLAYVKNIRSMLEIKDEQLRVLDRTVAYWKDKAADFEKKTPEFIEEVLAKRIRLREEEIQRLSLDQETHAKTVSMRTREVERLRAQLEQATYVGHALTYYDSESEAELPIPDEEVNLEELGEFFVDSASVLITDPMYVQSEWNRDEPYVEDRRYIHSPSNKTYVFGEDFMRFDEVLPGLDATANDLIKAGELRKVEVVRELNYSMPGALAATSTPPGYGALKFSNGNTGAGICLKTVYGDGIFTVYGERFRGDLVRVFIDLR
ncbi:hypothetical protein [Methylibium petroleiphilum]|uniref:hypothetical protein n=1 Tax=Methylibium petroleiphilum TaxID=105560 RepID=UPI001AC4575C|nr:hypothetical protein [Methylibium petroleiphilum]MBN9206954.1 hypothetical protein [Methylibium petroleiphilum]